MRKFLAIFMCKFLNKLSKLFGKKGTVIGGNIALKIDINILKKIKYPKYVIGVSGSSGKGSTTELIAGLLKYNNLTYSYNVEGSNALNGITSLILDNSNLKGIYKKDVLLMELDEKHSVNILKNFDLTHYVITNITRDQPPRNAHTDYIYNEMKKNINKNVHLIINADDPIVYKLSHNHKLNTYYGIDKNDYFTSSSINCNDSAYCPICGSKLEYEYYHYGHLGNYKCPNKDFYRPKLDVYINDLDIDSKLIKINNDKVIIKDNFFYLAYSYLACYSLGISIGIPKENILKYFDSIKNNSSFEKFIINDRTYSILLSKTETNLSYKQSFDYLKHQKGKKTIVMGYNFSSRRYKENDLSWLWDTDYEELNDKSIDTIILVGKFRYNILNRLLYASINKEKIILHEEYDEELMDIIKSQTNGNVYFIVWHDLSEEVENLLKAGEADEN